MSYGSSSSSLPFMRKDATQRGYDHKWRSARVRHLKKHPLCEYCKRDGHVIAATVVDHVIPHKGNKGLFWDKSNWQSLCTSCHSSVKQREEWEEEQRKKPYRVDINGWPVASECDHTP